MQIVRVLGLARNPHLTQKAHKKEVTRQAISLPFKPIRVGLEDPYRGYGPVARQPSSNQSLIASDRPCKTG